MIHDSKNGEPIYSQLKIYPYLNENNFEKPQNFTSKKIKKRKKLKKTKKRYFSETKKYIIRCTSVPLTNNFSNPLKKRKLNDCSSVDMHDSNSSTENNSTTYTEEKQEYEHKTPEVIEHKIEEILHPMKICAKSPKKIFVEQINKNTKLQGYYIIIYVANNAAFNDYGYFSPSSDFIKGEIIFYNSIKYENIDNDEILYDSYKWLMENIIETYVEDGRNLSELIRQRNEVRKINFENGKLLNKLGVHVREEMADGREEGEMKINASPKKFPFKSKRRLRIKCVEDDEKVDDVLGTDDMFVGPVQFNPHNYNRMGDGNDMSMDESSDIAVMGEGCFNQHDL